MAKRLGVDVRVTRALLEIGTMCAELGRFAEAGQIIRAVKAHRDDLPHPGTTLAMAYLFEERLVDAEDVLVNVQIAFPNHQLGKALLGWARRQLGRRGWEVLLQEVVDDGRDEWAIKLARTVLGFDYRPSLSPQAESSRRRVAPVFPGSYA